MLARSLALVCAVFIFGIAANELSKTLRFIDLVYVNERFEGGGARLSNVVSEYAEFATQVAAKSECRSDILDAAVGVALADLDRINPDTDYDRWDVAARRAYRLVEHATWCAPTVSDYWLRLAMLKSSAGEQVHEQAALMTRAAELDPASMKGLRGRFAQWRKLDAAVLKAAEPAIQKDLTTLLVYAPPQTVRDLLRKPSHGLLRYISNVAINLPQDRLLRLERQRAIPKS